MAVEKLSNFEQPKINSMQCCLYYFVSRAYDIITTSEIAAFTGMSYFQSVPKCRFQHFKSGPISHAYHELIETTSINF